MIVVMILVFIFSFTNSIYAYDDRVAHPALTEEATKNSKVGEYLQQNLGTQFSKGITSNVNGVRVVDWLTKGAELEDKEDCRRANHMHNPIKTWGSSYMNDEPEYEKVIAFCMAQGWWRYSNVTWSTSYYAPAPDAPKETFILNALHPPYTWDKARNHYIKALTSSENADRESNFAQSFETLGHVLHLLQDVSVPAHTRNDMMSHLFVYDPFTFGTPAKVIAQPFEKYVQSLDKLPDYTPVNNYPTFTDKSVSKFWDTDIYDKTNPSSSTTIGLAEYSNANYFSDWTIFKTSLEDSKHSFPYPAWTSVQEYDETDPYTLMKTTYLRKIGDVERIEHLAAGKWYYKYIPSFMKHWGLELDDKCHYDYAQKLLPRAVGYSAGLLDYFFRGTLEITAPKEYVYSITDGSYTPYLYQDSQYNFHQHQQFTKIKAQVKNITPKDKDADGNILTYESMTKGVIQAVAKYKIIPNYDPNLANYPTDGTAMKDIPYSYSIAESITLTPEQLGSMNMNPTQFTFDFTTSPIPAGITDLYLQVIFKGTLGNEKDTAVAVGIKNLREPTHHVFWNLTDMFSLDGHLYEAKDIRDNPALLLSAGSAHIDPYRVNFEISYMPESPPVIPPIKIATVEDLPWGRHIRLIALVDDELTYNYARLTFSDNIDNETATHDFAFEGVINEEMDGFWQTPTPLITFRNVKQHLYLGILRCKPVSVNPMTGDPYCSYPEAEAIPADTTPYPVIINFP